MAERDVTIIIVGKDKLSSVISSIGKKAESAGKKLKKSFVDNIDLIEKRSEKAGKALSVGITAPLTLVAAASVNTAVKAERLSKTLVGLAGSSENAASFIDSIKDASKGTIAEVDALAIANTALSFGVAKNADEMADLTEIAIALGRAQGVDAKTAVSDLTTALSRQSPMILDNLGITIKAGDANKAYAASVGKSVDELTAEEKALAFRTAALEAGSKVVARMGGVQDDMASSGERLRAQMSDMSLVIGNALIPVMQTGINIIGPLVTGFTNMGSGAQKVVIVFAALAAAVGPLLGIFSQLIAAVKAVQASTAAMNIVTAASNPAFLAVTAAVIATTIAYKTFRDAQSAIKEGQENVNAVLGTWSEVAQQAIDSGGNLSDVVVDMADKFNAASGELNKNGNILEDLGTTFVRTAFGNEILADAASAARKAIREQSSSLEEANAAIRLFNENVDSGSDTLKEFTQVAFQAGRASEGTGEALGQMAADAIESGAATEFLANALDKVGISQDDLANAQNTLTEAFSAGREVVEATAPTMGKILDVQRALANETQLGAVALSNANAAAMEYEQALVAQEEAQAKLNEESIVAEQQLAARALSSANAAARDYEAALRADAEAAAASKTAAEEQAAALEASAQRQADALAVARDAAIQNAEAFTSLSASLLEATDAQVAQALISQLDPSELGAEAFTTAVQDVQLAFGLADEESIALATNLGVLADAINEGVVPAEDASEALVAMQEAAAAGTTDVGALLDQFTAAPEVIGPTNEEIEKTNELLVATGEIAPDAGTGMNDFQGAVTDAQGAVEGILPQIQTLEDDLTAISKTWPVTVVFETVGTPPGGAGLPSRPPPTRQFGGIVPGPINSPQLIVAHGGEVVTNPNQPGALGGPGGPSFGGDTFNVTINDQLAMAMFMAEQQRRRFDRLEARM